MLRPGLLRTGLRTGYLLPEALPQSSLPPRSVMPSDDLLPESGLLRGSQVLHPSLRPSPGLLRTGLCAGYLLPEALPQSSLPQSSLLPSG